jgi:DNA polymerase III delta prime subunit
MRIIPHVTPQPKYAAALIENLARALAIDRGEPIDHLAELPVREQHFWREEARNCLRRPRQIDDETAQLVLRQALAARIHEARYEVLTQDEKAELAEDAQYLWLVLRAYLSGERVLEHWQRNCLRLPEEHSQDIAEARAALGGR